MAASARRVVARVPARGERSSLRRYIASGWIDVTRPENQSNGSASHFSALITLTGLTPVVHGNALAHAKSLCHYATAKTIVSMAE